MDYSSLSWKELLCLTRLPFNLLFPILFCSLFLEDNNILLFLGYKPVSILVAYQFPVPELFAHPSFEHMCLQ